MKRIVPLILLLLAAFTTAGAQTYVVQGELQDSQTDMRLMYATAAILQKDNTMIRSTMSDSAGHFRLEISKAGDYRLRLSYIGYKTQYKDIKLGNGTDSVNVGKVMLVSEENTLTEATVTATAARVQQIGDTTQFNAEAYRVPEGSTLEALIKQLPGVEVSDDGTITMNGKQVTEFLINGKDFFKGDTEIAMKNLPTELVSKIKAYDKKSDYAEQTGIDDGEENAVLDITTKRALNESWVTNADLAYGNKDRYSGRVFASRFTDQSRVSVFGQANNVGGRGFGGPRGFGGSQGLVAQKMAGADFSWENGKKKREAGRFEVGGNARYSHRSTDLSKTTNSETFLTSGGNNSFSNSRSKSGSHSTSVNTEFRLQWNPDSMTFINFRPSYSYSESRSNGLSNTATFNNDPYENEEVTDPLDTLNLSDAARQWLNERTVNRNNRLTMGTSYSNSFGATLNFIRNFKKKGRNISLRGQYNYTSSKSRSFSISDISYFTGGANTGNSFVNQFTATPNKNWNYSIRLGYVEPLGGNWYAEARYEFSERYQDSRRSLYNLAAPDVLDPKWSDAGSWLDSSSDSYTPIGTLPGTADILPGLPLTEAEMWEKIRDDYNSQYATYRYFNNRANVGVRYTTDKIRFNAGVSFNPQVTKMDYERKAQKIDTLITRHVLNVSPEVRFRYQFSRTNQLEVNYRGSSSQPSMTQLLAVVDDSDPLSISMGNPGLKPAWSNTLRAMYRGYNTETQTTLMGGVDFSSTSNSLSTRIVYDDETGVRYSRPENINGDWNVRGRFMANIGFGPERMFTLATHTNLSYTNNVGFVSRRATQGRVRSLVSAYYMPTAAGDEGGQHDYDYYNDIFENASSTKNTAKTFGFSERFNLSYRDTWFDVGITGSLNYQNSRNTVQTSGNLDTWQFSYGLTANATAPWGTAISTDIRMSSRRGYADRSMNTNELLWNAQISQSFLSGKPLTVSIQFYDILHKQSNVSRTINAQMRSDSWTNAINSYFMVHVIYRLNIFGGKANNKGSKDSRGGSGPSEMRAMPMMGPAMGGGRY